MLLLEDRVMGVSLGYKGLGDIHLKNFLNYECELYLEQP